MPNPIHAIIIIKEPVGGGLCVVPNQNQVVQQLKAMKLAKAAEILEEGIEETLTYMDYPLEHWNRLKTNNPLEQLVEYGRD